MKTIVALYDDLPAARRVLDDLDAAGLRRSFTMMGAAAAKAAGGLTAEPESGYGADYDSPGNRVATLTRTGVPQDDAQIYAEGMRRGGVLLIGKVDDARCDDALRIIEQYGPIDLDDRRRHYRESGWTGYDAGEDYDDARIAEERQRTGLGAAAAGLRDVNTGKAGTGSVGTGKEEHIPIVEEDVSVGKRKVEHGGVRVRSYAVETPVEKTVTLRDESVSVERRPVDRAVGEVPGDAFRDRTIEVSETDEEPVVRRDARVKEELVIRKDAEERQETVSETARRTEVEVDDQRGRTPSARPGRTDPGRTDV